MVFNCFTNRNLKMGQSLGEVSTRFAQAAQAKSDWVESICEN